MSTPDLLRYWPTQEDVVACVKTDAEAASEAVSLAVHQPLLFERRVIGAGADALPPCDEHTLLRTFLEPNLSEGRVIIPIVGSSGAGKSHVVRWIDAQLHRRHDCDQRIVIRIPKGTSLKGVLAILLRDLPDPEYDQYRQDLQKAQDALDPKEAAGLLCEMLAHTVEGLGSDARGRLVDNPGDKAARERLAYCEVGMLPTLLRNQLLRDQHFVRTRSGGDGVVKRLVEQLTEGRAPGAEDDRQHLFTAQDLDFSQVDRDSLGMAEKGALARLDREDRRQVAAKILNAALDDAKNRLLRIDPTVSDLFDAVRRQLLTQQRELVLLVEDFAAVSGMQKQLLQVIIKEAFRDGRQQLSTMRTVIAYTTGYMDTATVLTRANVEYRIPDDPGSEDDIFSRIERLVGAYLNAARLGQATLEAAYRTKDGGTINSREWVPKFASQVEPDARLSLDEFGFSTDGYELFPFNREAIRELSREGSMAVGKVIYNPRFVIQNVINRVLSDRDLFETGHFPPVTFGARNQLLPARLVEAIRVAVPIQEFDRYIRFLTYWGGVPTDIGEVSSIGARIFSTFGFDKRLFGEMARITVNAKVPAPPLRPASNVNAEQPPNPIDARDPQETKWEAVLEHWRAGQTLSQSDANKLRRWIAEALDDYVNFDFDLHRPLKDRGISSFYTDIFIPRAQGHQGRQIDDEANMLSVCLEADLLDPGRSAGIQSALMALIRYQVIHNATWDYTGAIADLPRYAAFIEGIAEKARTFVIRRYFKAAWNPIPALVQGLLIGARALGIEAATKDRQPSSLIASLFEVSASPPPQEGDAAGGDGANVRWREFVTLASQCRRDPSRGDRDNSSWQSRLLDLIGARQGGADLVHAIDVMRLKPAIDEATKNWEFNETVPNPAGISELPPFRSHYAELKRLSGSLPKVQEQLVKWRRDMLEWLGDDFDKEGLARQLRETIEASRAAGVAGGLDANGLLRLLEEFRTSKVKATLDDIAKIDGNVSRALLLSVLGRGHASTVRLIGDLQARTTVFMTTVEDNLTADESKYGEDPTGEALTALIGELQSLRGAVQTVEEL